MTSNRGEDYEKYFELQRDYEAKYGPKTVVLMGSGTMYYILEYDLPNRKEGKVYHFQEVVFRIKGKEFIITKPKEGPHQIGNPYRLNFNKENGAFEHYKIRLLELGYTLVMYEQKKRYITNKKGLKRQEIYREVDQVLTKGTDIDRIQQHDNITNKLICLVIEVTKKEKKIDMSSVTIGYSSIDLVSGKVEMLELYGSKIDPQMCLLKLSRILSIQPKELLIYLVSAPPKYYSYIHRYLKLHKYPSNTILVHNQIDKEYFRSSYQSQLLKKVYPGLSIDQVNNISINLIAGSSLVALFNYCYDHNPILIEHLLVPELIRNNDRMFISRPTINHLSIYNSHYLEKKREYQNIDSLLSLLDLTKTHMGKRYLVKRFSQPYTKVDKIEFYHNIIEELISNRPNILDPINKILALIPDIELLHRKLKIGSISPRDLARMIKCYEQLSSIFDIIKKENVNLLNKLAPNSNIQDQFTNLVKLLVNMVDLGSCDDSRIYDDFIESESPLFKALLGEEFEPVQISNYKKILEDWTSSHQQILVFGDTIKSIIGKPPKIIYKDDHYHITVAKTQLEDVEKSIDNLKKVLFNGVKQKRYHIYTPNLALIIDKASKQRQEYQLVSHDVYTTLIEMINKKYVSIFTPLSKFIARLDFLCSGAIGAIKYNYVKPKLKVSDKSYLSVKDIRHPIIERIIDDIYVPNDFEIGGLKTPYGNLLFGCNSAGKSTLTKAIGTLVIMAQVGYYVPASSCEISPYEYLLTRLSGNDNMYTGDSSFVVEMKELRTVLKYDGPKTLILGDELCRGTGWFDGAGLTISTLKTLLEDGCQFIFSTHMHILTDLPHFKSDIEEGNLRVCHLDLEKGVDGEIIYDRKLKSGRGRTHYGIDVAESVGLDKEVIDKAREYRKDVIEFIYGHRDELYSTKRSRYNGEVYMNSCQLCGSKKDLETHHIHEQRLANSDNYIGHIPKNSKGNLVVLCRGGCHRDMDRGYSVKKIGTKYIKISNEPNK